MTAPVLQQDAPGESLPMTAPVLQSGDSMRMAFVMPAERTIDDLPIPNNADVTLSDVDWGEVAAIRFAGRGKQARFQEAEAELRAVLKSQQRTPAGPALQLTQRLSTLAAQRSHHPIGRPVASPTRQIRAA